MAIWKDAVMTARSPRITLAIGGEQVLIDRAVDRAIREIRADQPGELSGTRVQVAASDPSAAVSIHEAMSPTLFGDVTVLVVTGIDAATAEVDAALRDLAHAQSADCFLIATHPGGVKGKNLLDALRAAGAVQIDCPVLKRGRATMDFLEGELRHHRRTMAPGALAKLVDAVGQDLGLLTAAVEQLVADVEDDPITHAHVEDVYSGVAEVSGFAIADAVWDRRSVDALRSLRWAMANSEAIGVPTVMALASGLRSIVRVAGLGPRASENEVAREASVPPWKVKALRRQWSTWSGDQRRLAVAVVALADADAAVKGGVAAQGSLDPQQKLMALERLVLSTAAREPSSP